MSQQNPRFTIITVVYNDIANIEKTLTSVIDQSFTNYEYIVVDGASSDGTTEAINKYSTHLKDIISEKDNGIYDAMNKGIRAAAGEWLIFLNSGDLLFDKNVLHKLDTIIREVKPSTVVVYGDVEVLIPEQGIQKVVKAKPLSNLERAMPFNHQSAVIRTSTHKENFYDLNYRIVADYNFFIDLYIKKLEFHYAEFAISSILAGGLSDNRRDKTFLEMRNVHDHFFPSRNNKKIYLQTVIHFMLGKFFKKIAPKAIVQKIYKTKYK